MTSIALFSADVSGNRASLDGGGLFITSLTTVITSSTPTTFSRNAAGIDGAGGAVYVSGVLGSSADLLVCADCLFESNQAVYGVNIASGPAYFF
jgi:hypothetical protein